MSYLVRLTNGLMLHMDLYVVHETPQPMEQILPSSSALHYQGFQWIPVQRSECQKGCEVCQHLEADFLHGAVGFPQFDLCDPWSRGRSCGRYSALAA